MRVLFAGLAALLLVAADTGRLAPVYAPVTPAQAIAFPRDHGSHPQFRTEWWYVTGWLDGPEGPLGFQVTFFRTRPDVDQANPSAFAARQVLFAHAALSDPKKQKLLHSQRVARAGFGLAEASETDANLVLDDWSLRRGPDNRWRTHAGGSDFALDLVFTPSQPPILQGVNGFSRKGPQPTEASHYYSLPHMAVTGTVLRKGRRVKVTGEAWLDREWSSTLLNPAAVGWDWAGLNLKDGGALTAFQVRDAAGKPLWTGGSYRSPSGRLTVFRPGQLKFEARRRWTSPRTKAVYPVEQAITAPLPGGPRTLVLKPLFDDQELDSRAGGGPVYWEGAVSSEEARGYLELTGYFGKLTL
ncbi:MAG: carotenoid 1,2-hydratase [Caulobacter sp.]|jgi:predicted secreted hydrolase|nr:carotenoid 1,2-hydratase [Caulobacter sp.]